MRTIVNRATVAHLFANQAQEYATTPNRNFYFNGALCNSYGSHFRAAVHHGDTVLLNSDRYSNTTARQLSELRNACSHLRVYEVPNPDAETKQEHRKNFHFLASEYENEVLRASRARICNSFDIADRMFANANDYAARFKIGNRIQAIDVSDIAAKIETRKARETAAEKRATKAREKRAAEELAEREEKHAIRLAEWYAGNRSYNELPMRYSKPVALRLTSDGETVQTSQGAEFPAAHARRSIAFVLDCFATGKDFIPNGRRIRLGSFQIDRIRGERGLLLAGCHTVTRSEIEKLAALLAATQQGPKQ